MPRPSALQRAATTAIAVLSLFGWAAAPADADSVTYTWVTDSVTSGVGPTSASFQVPLSDVQSGKIPGTDITNINFSIPGIGPLSFTTSSALGSDNAAFVNPTTGAEVSHDANQGLAVIGYQGALFSNTFLSIEFDNPGGDTFNSLNSGDSLGAGTGHWVASFPTTTSGTPEPTTLALLGAGAITVAAFQMLRRRTRVTK